MCLARAGLPAGEAASWQEVASRLTPSRSPHSQLNARTPGLNPRHFYLYRVRPQGDRPEGKKRKRAQHRRSWERWRPQQSPSCFTEMGQGCPEETGPDPQDGESDVLHRDKGHVPNSKIERATWQRCPRVTESRFGVTFSRVLTGVSKS